MCAEMVERPTEFGDVPDDFVVEIFWVCSHAMYEPALLLSEASFQPSSESRDACMTQLIVHFAPNELS
jgi:hypothetical protein